MMPHFKFVSVSPIPATTPTHGTPVGLAAAFALPTEKTPVLPAVQTELWIPKHATLLKLLHRLVAVLVGNVVAALPLIVVLPPTTTVTPPPAPSRSAVHAA
ncbi:hypothetical protein N0V82_008323 [Gnomoniopsis sp. IMI 355080]|nr:hypothetical protein N0V82_008323 [Gnomoniopsis sp. IMI 355080]